jgi:hypothetical protein
MFTVNNASPIRDELRQPRSQVVPTRTSARSTKRIRIFAADLEQDHSSSLFNHPAPGSIAAIMATELTVRLSPLS